MLGTVSKKWTFFSNNYTVDFRGWDIEGNIMGWDYSVTSSSGTVATITKKLFSFGDSYEINVRDNEDVEEIIMLVLAIDAVNENKNGGVSVSVSD